LNRARAPDKGVIREVKNRRGEAHDEVSRFFHREAPAIVPDASLLKTDCIEETIAVAGPGKAV
jgi:hypothetical protein